MYNLTPYFIIEISTLLTKEILIISMQFSFVSLFEPFDQKKVT